MKFTTLIRLGLLAVMISALAGCGGGSDGAPGAAGPAGTPGTGGSVVAANLSSDQWLALKPSIDPASISVTINSPPVVKFKVTDQYGNPLVGLGGQVQGTASALPKNYNIVFTLAKLVPVVGGPSVWRSYLVTKPAVSGGVVSWSGTFPTFEQEGTLVETINGVPQPAGASGDGGYQYTFYRDIKQAATIVAGLTDSGSKLKADLGDVSYDPTLTHRLGIVIQGSEPGTGTNTPNGVQVTTPVPIVNTFNIGYDFRPDGGTITTTRDIVEKASCTECHQGRGIGHFSPNYTTSTDPARGTPAGAFIGRNDPRLCVTCHTDQTKYGFAEAPTVAGSGTTPAGGYDDTSSIGYKRVKGEAAFTYPRMIHQTHMGNKLDKFGYNLNGHAKKSDGTTGCDSTSSNAAQCYNLVEYPQDVRNCTKCHDGSANAVNKTKDGDNWKNVPSRIACGACHDGINFADGTGQALKDKGTVTMAGHLGGTQTDDSLCTTCHSAGNIDIYHGPISASNPNGIPASAAASLRTMSSTITAAAVDPTDGSVTVSFTLADTDSTTVLDLAGASAATPVVYPVVQGANTTDLPFISLNFTLAKLMPSSNGASTNWKNYTGKCNVNNAGPQPEMVALETTPGVVSSIPASAYHNILQGYSEIQYGQLATGKPTMAPGILTSLGSGKWTYKFALVNANTHNADGSGDIRTITSAINLNTNASALALDYTNVPTCPDPDAGYDANLTHRIGMIAAKNDGSARGTDFATNATFDFVPNGAKAETRNIVTMDNCATCHAGRKIHKGYATELCVTCHNQYTSDPSAKDATRTVDLKFIVHKLHYKGTAQWVHDETFGTGNMIGYPGNVMKCTVCHNENATKPGTTTKLENAAAWYTTPTAEACGTCHDDAASTAHIQTTGISGFGTPQAVEMCTVCHGAGSADGLDAKSVHLKLLP